MRIAVIGSRGAPSDHACNDAIQVALTQIYPRLARRGHDVEIFSECNGRSLGEIEGARTIRVPNLGLGEAGTHAVLSSLLSSMRGYDVVNFCASETSGLFSLAAKLGSGRTVVSVHGLTRPPARSLLPLPAPESVAARFADAITVVSRRLERHFRDTWGRETFYIPNGIMPPARPADDGWLEALGLLPGGYVLAADRMVPSSGMRDAVAVANAGDGRFRLVVAETGEGDDEYRTRLRRGADPGKVVFLDGTVPARLDLLMANAALFLQPSLADQPPPTLLQALAHGRAVLVSDLPEHLDLIGPDGFTFTAGDVGDLRRVLVWLLSDREAVAQMERRTTATVASRYCWDRIAEAYETVFASVLA